MISLELPVEMGRLFRLKELNVEGNPLLAPPQGVIQGGLEVLIAYLRLNNFLVFVI